MFCLIQRGQIYTDFDGYPVTIYRCDADRIVYRRNDSQRILPPDSPRYGGDFFPFNLFA